MTWSPIPSFNEPRYTDTNLNQIQKLNGWYLEKAAGSAVLVSLQGHQLKGTVANNTANRRAFYFASSGGGIISIHGNTLYIVDASGTSTANATLLSTSSGDCYFSENNVNQVLIVDGTYGYIYNTAASTLTKITDVNFPASPATCTYLNSRFIVNNQATGRFYESDLEDGLTWTPAIFATAEAAGDNLYAVWSTQDRLILFGRDTIEHWVPSDNNPYFQPITGAVLPYGCQSYTTIAKNGDAFFFYGIGPSVRGAIFVLQAGQCKMISEPYISDKISDWLFGNCYGYTYMNQGAAFYEIVNTTISNFPAWQYNITNGTWAELDSTNRPIKFVLNAWDATSGAFPPMAFERATGKVHWLGNASNPYNSYNGTAITRTLDFKVDAGISHTTNQGLRFELEIQHDSSATYTLSATLTKSDDGGLTFGGSQTLSKAITSGTTAQQVILTSPPLGSFKAGRIYRLVFTGPSARIIFRRAEGLVRVGRF